MTPEQKAAHYHTAYDVLKGMFLLTTIVLVGALVTLTFVVINASKAIELNSIRYHEMQKSYDEQAIYFNNMKARIQAMNLEKKENE